MKTFLTIIFSFLFYFLFPLPSAQSQVFLRLPETVRGDVADFIVIKADTNGKMVKWKVLDTDLKLFPVELLKESKVAIVSARKLGTFRIMAVTALGDEPSEIVICKVVIGNGPPDPPPPDNNVDDPLTVALQKAYANDSSPDKATYLKSLISLFKSANVILDQAKTTGQLFNALKQTSKTLLPNDDVLRSVREVIQVEFKKVLPENDVELSDQQRQLIRGFLTKLTASLEVLK